MCWASGADFCSEESEITPLGKGLNIQSSEFALVMNP